jgi:hypothetical protein
MTDGMIDAKMRGPDFPTGERGYGKSGTLVLCSSSARYVQDVDPKKVAVHSDPYDTKDDRKGQAEPRVPVEAEFHQPARSYKGGQEYIEYSMQRRIASAESRCDAPMWAIDGAQQGEREVGYVDEGCYKREARSADVPCSLPLSCSSLREVYGVRCKTHLESSRPCLSCFPAGDILAIDS